MPKFIAHMGDHELEMSGSLDEVKMAALANWRRTSFEDRIVIFEKRGEGNQPKLVSHKPHKSRDWIDSPDLSELENDRDVLFLRSLYAWKNKDREGRQHLTGPMLDFLHTMSTEEGDALVAEKGWDHVAMLACKGKNE